MFFVSAVFHLGGLSGVFVMGSVIHVRAVVVHAMIHGRLVRCVFCVLHVLCMPGMRRIVVMNRRSLWAGRFRFTRRMHMRMIFVHFDSFNPEDTGIIQFSHKIAS
jgi:hypothetical protein